MIQSQIKITLNTDKEQSWSETKSNPGVGEMEACPNKESAKKTKKSGKSAAVVKAEAKVTPGRKSSRQRKLTQKMMESWSQKNLKDPESEDFEEDKESLDAIAEELEKSDSSDTSSDFSNKRQALDLEEWKDTFSRDEEKGEGTGEEFQNVDPTRLEENSDDISSDLRAILDDSDSD